MLPDYELCKDRIFEDEQSDDDLLDDEPFLQDMRDFAIIEGQWY